MKICMVADNVHPPYGGMETSLIRHTKIMRSMGHDIFVLTAKKPGERKKENVEHLRLYRFAGIPQPKTKPYIYWAFPSKGKIAKILREEKPDIVHVHFPTYLGLISVKAANELNIPVIFTHHTHIEQVLPNIRARDVLIKKFHILIDKWFEYIYNRVDVIIALTPKAQNRLKKRYPGKRVEWVSNGIPLEEFKPTYKKSEKPTVLYVGRLMAEKNVDTLIKAMKIVQEKTNDAKLIIRGDGYLKKELTKLSRDEGVYVDFLPRLSHEELCKLYDSSWVLVLPSHSEPEGLTVLEAMAMGTPVVVSKSADISHHMIIEGYNGYTFQTKSPEDLANKIMKITENMENVLEMGKNAREFVKRYSVKESVRKILKIYEDISS